MRQIAQPRRLVDGGARVVAAVAQLYFAGVYADPQLDRRQICPLEAQRSVGERRRRAAMAAISAGVLRPSERVV